MKVGDVYVVFDNRGEQCRVTITQILGRYIYTTGAHARWTAVGGGSDTLRCTRATRYVYHMMAKPAGPWDERKRVNAARTAVQDALSADKSGAVAIHLAECLQKYETEKEGYWPLEPLPEKE